MGSQSDFFTRKYARPNRNQVETNKLRINVQSYSDVQLSVVWIKTTLI